MAEKLINTRIALRIDTFENWSKTEVAQQGANLVLKRGEIGLCEIPSGNAAAQTAPTVLFKVGDGTSTFGELKWASALAADVYGWAKASDVILEGEVIKFVGTDKTIDLSKFALNSELSQAIADLEAADAALGKRIDDVVAAAYDDTEVRGLITAEETARKAADEALEGKVTAAQGAADKAQGEVDTLEGVVATLTQTVASEDARVAGLVKTEEDARKAADEAIEGKIGTVAEGKTVVGLIGEAQTAAEGKVTELANGQVKTNKEAIEAIEADYLKGQDRTELEAAISEAAANAKAEAIEEAGVNASNQDALILSEAQSYADGKVAEVAGDLDDHLEAYATKVGALEDADAALDGKIAKEAQDRASEITRVEGLVSTEKSRAEGIEAGLRADITNIQNNIASGLHFRGIKSALSDITDPANGDIVIVGTQEYIYDGTSWEEFGNAEAHATNDALTTGLAAKVDKTVYDAKVAELVAEDADIRDDFAAADASLKSELEGKINLKAAQADFEALEDRVDGHDTELAKKALAADLTGHIATYNAHLTAQEAIDSAQNDRIKAVEDSLAAGGTINDLIVAAQNQANKGVADAKAAQDDIDELAGKVGVISGDQTLVEQLAAVKATADAAAKASDVEASIAAINAEVAKKATIETVNGIDSRLCTAEGKITAAEGNITTLQGQVTALEGRYTDAQVDTAISNAVAAEKQRAEAAESALDQRIDAYDERFGTKDDILVFNCGSSTTVI